VKRLFRTLVALVALALLGMAVFVLAARSGWLKPDEAEMRARYGLPGSQYIALGTQQLHYVEEGSGPVVVLVHGSYASLRQWDHWADALKGNYRVIRFDRPGMGLSGPSPDARYDGGAEAPLILALADRLGLGKFVLVGTSSSGEGAARFAAQHPDRIQGLVLANIAAGPIKMDPSHMPPRLKRVLSFEKWLKGYHLKAFWEEVLKLNMADQTKVTPELVTEWTDLNNRAQGWPRKPWPDGKPPFSGTPDDLRAITAPTLLLWSDGDHETPAETHGQQALALLPAKDKRLQVIARCGHMMPADCGPQSAVAAKVFLDRISAK
jgi:pimeloyl-ACP methyl ester carboxylesterase